MPSPEASLIVDKIRAATAQGDLCMGRVFGRSSAEWIAIFNEAARELDMPVHNVPALAGGTRAALQGHLTNLASAFSAAGGKPSIILLDASGNDHMRDPNVNLFMAQRIEHMARVFPQAVYVQIIPQAPGNETAFYCMNPRQPRDPSQPIHPV